MQIKYFTSVANHGVKQHNLHIFQFPSYRNDFSVGEEIITQDHFQLELMNPSSSLRDQHLGKFDQSAEKLLERNPYSTRV